MIHKKSIISLILSFLLLTFSVNAYTWENHQYGQEDYTINYDGNSGYSALLKSEGGSYPSFKKLNFPNPQYALTTNFIGSGENYLLVFGYEYFSVFNENGTKKSDGSYEGSPISNPLIFDIDNDGNKEVIIPIQFEDLFYIRVFNYTNSVLRQEYIIETPYGLSALVGVENWDSDRVILAFDTSKFVRAFTIINSTLTEKYAYSVNTYYTDSLDTTGVGVSGDINSDGFIEYCFVSKISTNKGVICVNENINGNNQITSSYSVKPEEEIYGLALGNLDGGNNELIATMIKNDTARTGFTPSIIELSPYGSLLRRYDGASCRYDGAYDCNHITVSYPTLIDWDFDTITDYVCFYGQTDFDNGLSYSNIRQLSCHYAGNLSIMPGGILIFNEAESINNHYYNYRGIPAISTKVNNSNLSQSYIDYLGNYQLKTFFPLAGLGVYQIGSDKYYDLYDRAGSEFINGLSDPINNLDYTSDTILSDMDADGITEVITMSEDAVYIYKEKDNTDLNTKPQINLISTGSNNPMCLNSRQYYFLTQYYDAEGDALTLNVRCGDTNILYSDLEFYGSLFNVSCPNNITGTFSDFIYLYDTTHSGDTSINQSIIRTVTTNPNCYGTLQGGFSSGNTSETQIGDPCSKNEDCTYGVCNNNFCDTINTGSCDNNKDCLTKICNKGQCTKPSTWDLTNKAKSDNLGDDTNTNNMISIVIMIILMGVIMFFTRGHIIGIVCGVVAFFISGAFFTIVGWLSGFIMFMLVLGLILLILVILLIFSRGG